jgi:hypothetical protein
MTDRKDITVSRRTVVQAGIATGVTTAIGSAVLGALGGARANAAAPMAPILRTIPSSGEKIPAVGIGTNAFGVSAPEELAAIREVLKEMPGLGSKVIDTARGCQLRECRPAAGGTGQSRPVLPGDQDAIGGRVSAAGCAR